MQVPHEVPLEERVQRGESQKLEFKRSLSLRREGLEALCAMVNSDLARGTVVFGIESDGTVCGVEQGNLDTAQRSLLQVVRDKFEPPMVVQIEVQELMIAVFSYSVLEDMRRPLTTSTTVELGSEKAPATADSVFLRKSS